MPSIRADLITRRTYCRPLANGKYETWEQVVDRVIGHQRWLWERALCSDLNTDQEAELEELRQLMLDRVALPSGRILWMGGTDQALWTEIAMFNCAFLTVRDIFSAVDAFYLLLNGCGVGFKPEAGLLNGFVKPTKIEVLDKETIGKGNPDNVESFGVSEEGVYWHLTIGDSGVAWAKAFGKLLAMKKSVDKIYLDFSEIRPAGSYLSGYGWLSSGSSQIKDAFLKICEILNNRADELLDEIDILDIINLVGTTLTSRRSAEIALLNADSPNAERFAVAKKDHYLDKPWRSQSNNSLVFYKKPTKLELKGLFQQMLEAGGSEPGLYNGEAARRRAPWFSGTNPCGEILLPDGGLCNLVEVDLGKLIRKGPNYIMRVFQLIARANYRQTCVSLKDGVLSDKWHETNQFLRLCGVGITGVVKWLDAIGGSMAPIELAQMNAWATEGAYDMAHELNLPCSKAVTTIKPSGTLGKIMDTTEGLHRPISRYLMNWVKFHSSDPTLAKLIAAGYRIIEDPYSDANVLVGIPVDNGDMDWTEVDVHGETVLVNMESAVDQLKRYKLVMSYYVDHNASVTIYYSDDEIPEIVDWLHANWDSYVGVSFIKRTDPTKTAKDFGYPYLPQEPISARQYHEYLSRLKPLDFDGGDMLDINDCDGGACPVR